MTTPPTGADMTVVEHTVHIEATPETVWSFWTEPERLAQWWGSSGEIVAEPGGIFRTVMDNGPVMRGEFVELDKPRRLVFTFGWEQNAPGEPLAPGSTTVEVTLTPDDRGTVLQLRHSEMPVTHAHDHEHGWLHFIDTCLVAAIAAQRR